jgi:hypothetical protein
LFFEPVSAIDGAKLGEAQGQLAKVRTELLAAGNKDPQAALASLTDEQRTVIQASIAGDRKTLVADAAIPTIMALIYLALLLYFKSIGGYKPLHLAGTDAAKMP